ncbi:hypothetical protein [uncultured Rothia sp.]|uniref:hypothetical protein n=1 Tax=uncultured Rothia sp. TaxID=316088 RepID=UPI0032172729
MIDTILTGLSMAGGIFSWWQATGSRKARKEAEASTNRAEQQLETAKKQVRTLQELVDGLKPPVLEMHYSSGDTWLLKNNSATSIRVEELMNANEFSTTRYLDTPFDIAPFASKNVMLYGTRLPKCSKTLQLKLGNGEETRIPFEPKPRNH